MRALRFVAGIIVGFACAAAVAKLAFGVLEGAWPAYAAAVPDKSYTLAMLFSRLGVAALITVCAAAAAVLVARDRRIAWVLGGLFVLVSLPSHLHFVWADYPAWYHAVYLLGLVPLAWLGGGLVPTQRRQPSAGVSAPA